MKKNIIYFVVSTLVAFSAFKTATWIPSTVENQKQVTDSKHDLDSKDKDRTIVQVYIQQLKTIIAEKDVNPFEGKVFLFRGMSRTGCPQMTYFFWAFGIDSISQGMVACDASEVLSAVDYDDLKPLDSDKYSFDVSKQTLQILNKTYKYQFSGDMLILKNLDSFVLYKSSLTWGEFSKLPPKVRGNYAREKTSQINNKGLYPN